MKKSFRLHLGILFFSLAISVPLLLPYLHPGYFPTHDGEWAVVRLGDMFRELKDFQIPPRYSGILNFSWGYPLFNFTYPSPYYLGVIFHFFGLGFVGAVKFIFAATIPLSAFFMFLFSRKIWSNNFAGIVSSVLYLYFPYRLIDLFVRGSIGESIAFALFPIILLSLVNVFEKPKSVEWKIIGAISYSVLIMSHNIMAVLFSIFMGIFFIGNFLIYKQKIIKPFLFIFIFGILTSSYFWSPALFEKNNILLSQVPIADRSLYFVSIKQLLNSPWGYGVPTDGANAFSYQIGWQSLLVIVGLLFVFVSNLKKGMKQNSLVVVLFAGLFILTLFLFSFSSLLWKLPFLSEINYPWTMLSQLGLLLSILGGYLVVSRIGKTIAIGACVLGLFLYVPLAKPTTYFDKGDSYYLTNVASTTSSNELMPIWVKKLPYEAPNEKVEVLGNGQIDNLSYNSKRIDFSTILKDQSTIRINTIYYPGWKILADGKTTSISYDNQFGVMDIKLPKGKHTITASFSETTERFIADLVSIISLIVLIALGLKKTKQERD